MDRAQGASNAQAYVVRAWHEGTTINQTPIWRFALVDVLTGRRMGFTSMDDLFRSLCDQLVARDYATSAWTDDDYADEH